MNIYFKFVFPFEKIIIKNRYGVAETLLSYALKQHQRSSYYLATKVGRYNSDKPCNEWFDFSYKKTIESVENSLRIFDTEYIDLIQVNIESCIVRRFVILRKIKGS
jgi:predicted oxidoreductase